MKTFNISSITVVRSVSDLVILHVEGMISPVWPFNEGLTLTFTSAKPRTEEFLKESFPGIPVNWVGEGK